MNFKKISSSSHFKIVSVILVSLLTIATITPTATFVGEFLASYAVQIMVSFLVVGFLGFIYRHNTLILINFIACMVLCSFLKEQEQQTIQKQQACSSSTIPLVTDVSNLQNVKKMLHSQQKIKAIEVDL